MTNDETTHHCPRCRAEAVGAVEECPACGFPFQRLCVCGATYRVFEGRCSACGRSHRRESSRSRGRRFSLTEALAAPFRGPLEAGRRLAGAFRRRPRRRPGDTGSERPLPSRPSSGECPHCAKALTERSDACPHCLADLGLLCRCGARYHRVFDTNCAECGRQLHRRKRTGRRLTAVVLGAGLAVGIIGGVAWFAVPRGSPAKTAGYLQGGVEALKAGQYERATRWLGEFLDVVPDHAYARFCLGYALYHSGREARGMEEIRRAEELDPTLHGPLVFLGRIALEDGRAEEARVWLERAVRTEPRPPEALLMLGRLHLEAGRIALGITQLERALDVPMAEPPVEAALVLADLFRRRAELLGRPEDVSESRRLYSLVLGWLRPGAEDARDPERNAGLARAYLGLGSFMEAQYRAQLAEKGFSGPRKADMMLLQARALAGQGAPEQSGALARRALETDPGAARRVAVATMLGEVAATEGKAKALAEAVRDFPDDLAVWTAWGYDRAERGEAGAAADALRDREVRFGGEVAYWVTLGTLLRQAGRDEAALEVLADARRRFPGDRDLRFRELSARLEILGSGPARPSGARWGEAIREVDAALTDDPEHPLPLLLKGKALLFEDRNVEAQRYFADAGRVDPTDLEIAIYTGICWYRSGNFAEGADRLEHALARTGAELPGPRLSLADCYLRLRLNERAAAVAREVVSKSPGSAEARRLLGRIYLAAERFEEARREFEALRDLDAGNVETALYLAYLSLATGRTEDAERAFAAARGLAKGPEESFRVARVEAEYYRRVRQTDRAVEVLEDFVSANPGRSDARLGMADFLLSLGRTEDALDAYRKTLSLDPDNVDVRRRLCEFRFEDGSDLAEVERQITEIERRVPGAPDLEYLRGKLATARGDFRGGVESLTAYVQTRPEDPDGQYALGVALYRSGRVEDALTRIEAAQGLLPHSPAIRQVLGQVVQARAAELYSAGDYEGARVLLERALRYDPGLTDAQLILASSLVRLGQLAGSEDYALAVVRREPDNVEALRLLGAIRAGRGRLEEAADAYQRAAAVAESPSYDRYLLAGLYLQMGNDNAALEEARRAAAGAEDPLFAADVIVAALVRKGLATEAEEMLRGILARRPDSPQAHALLGAVRWARKDLGGARQSFSAALDFDAKFYPALWQLVRLELEARGDRKAAMQEARFRLEANPDDVELNYIVAWLHSKLLERAEAVPYLEKALTLNPEHRSSALLLAKVRRELGDPTGGRDGLLRVLRRFPRDAEALFDLAASYDLGGNAELAIEKYRDALAADPTHAPSLNNLAMHLIGVSGRLDEARSLIERAVTQDPKNPVYLDTLGRVQFALRNYPEAERALLGALGGFQERKNRLETRMVTLKPSERAFFEQLKAELGVVMTELDETKAGLEAVSAARDGD